MTEWNYCGLGRRLLAILYDSIVVLAILFIATVPVVFVTGGALDECLLYRTALQAYELLVAFLFFGVFWRAGGQTIGMRAWRIRVIRDNGERLRWRDAALRYVVAIVSWAMLGLGFAWSLFDHERRIWHDIASRTLLIRDA
jgi:uncharacterized RDD family membrane protein YckC